MRTDCNLGGLFLGILWALFPLREASAGPARDAVKQPVRLQPKGPETGSAGKTGAQSGSDGKSVVATGKRGELKPVVKSASSSGSSAGAGSANLSARPGQVPERRLNSEGRSGPQVSGGLASAKLSAPPGQPLGSTGKPAGESGARGGRGVVPKLEAFQKHETEKGQRNSDLRDSVEDPLKWTRLSTGRDDYFPALRLLGWNSPLVRQVTEMRLAMEAGYPRRPPKLPRIVVEIPKLGPVSSGPMPEPKNGVAPDSDAAVEFFSEPAVRSGVDIGIGTVVVPIFRVAQPPPVPPVESRANLRQE